MKKSHDEEVTMDRIYIADKTLKQNSRQLSLSFREKIELARMIDRLGVDLLELPPIERVKVDSLMIKSVAAAVSRTRIAVPVGLSPESVALTWNALREAPSARMQVSVPVSSVQMEYLYHLKPASLLSRTAETVRLCAEKADEVELIAGDATRGDSSFLISIIHAAVEAGATIVTLCDASGEMMPEELRSFLNALLPQMADLTGKVRFGIDCSNTMNLADACAVEAVRCGIREIKTASFPVDCVSLSSLVRILHGKGEKLGVQTAVRQEELRRITGQIAAVCGAPANPLSPFESGVRGLENDEAVLGVHDARESVLRAIEQLGYILSPEDQEKVYASFLAAAEKKGTLSLRELDAIIAAEAMQVPPVYQMTGYLINTGSGMGAMAHMKLLYHGQETEGVSAGDGVIDAAFLALEQAVGRHFELDDFQIKAVTEGQEAMGETIVRLRSEGKLYSGRGISTDIVGASIMAYMNALNKIVYEEEEA